MRKRVLLALTLVCALLLSTGCSLIVKNEEVDKQTVIIEAAGKTITKGEVQAETDALLDYYASVYPMYYGVAFDPADPDTIKATREQAVEGLVELAVMEKKIAELGLDQFTAEEEAEIKSTIDEQYESYASFVKSYALSDTELTGDELQTAIDEQMIVMGYGTKEQMLEAERMTRAQDRLVDSVTSAVSVSDEEVQAEYDYRLYNAKSTYEEYPYAYGVDLTNGTVGMYYAPAGYRYVKHILIQFNADDQTTIDELNTQLAAKQNELADAQETEALNAEIAALEAELDAAKENAYAAIQPTIEEIQQKLAEGESFDSLIDAYNQDPGMTSASEGYAVSAVSTNWVQEFTDASMKLENIGDISEPVRSSYGIHIIQYASDIPEGEIGLENVREELTQELLTTKQDNAFISALEQWVEEANAKVYLDRL